MPEPIKILHAEIREITLGSSAQEINADKTLKVQFNPEKLKVTFANQSAGGDQRGGSSKQHVGAGTTKLTLELWFDVTAPLEEGEEAVDDVRKLTQKVAYFITPKKVGREKWLPPGVRFIWGSFKFDGVMDSLDENLEFFSEDGKPLRASASISLSRQEIQFQFGDQTAPGIGSALTPGTEPRTVAKAGDSVPKMAGRQGKQNDASKIAAANGIENPRFVPPGALINMDAGISGGIGIGGGVSGGIGLGASAGISGGISAGVSGGLGVSASGSAGFGIGASGGGSFGIGGSAGVGASGGGSFGIGGSAGISGSSAGVRSGISGSGRFRLRSLRR